MRDVRRLEQAALHAKYFVAAAAAEAEQRYELGLLQVCWLMALVGRVGCFFVEAGRDEAGVLFACMAVPHETCALHKCCPLLSTPHYLHTQAAVNITSQPLLSYLPTLWSAPGQQARDAFDLAQMVNATCTCTNGTDALVGTAGFTGRAAYLAANCTGEGGRISLTGIATSTAAADEQRYAFACMPPPCKAA